MPVSSKMALGGNGSASSDAWHDNRSQGSGGWDYNRSHGSWDGWWDSSTDGGARRGQSDNARSNYHPNNHQPPNADTHQNNSSRAVEDGDNSNTSGRAFRSRGRNPLPQSLPEESLPEVADVAGMVWRESSLVRGPVMTLDYFKQFREYCSTWKLHNAALKIHRDQYEARRGFGWDED